MERLLWLRRLSGSLQLEWWVSAMSPLISYRGYFIDHRNHVRSVVVIEAADTNTACVQAESLLRETRFAAIEIWDGPRIVGRRTANRWAAIVWPFGKHSDGVA
jgi:hypothetical protein